MSVLGFLAKVLMIGHSLVGPDLPGMVEAGLRHAGVPAEVQAQVINGAPLSFNRSRPDLAEGANGPAELARGETDVLVLTEALPLAAQVEWADSRAAAADWAGLAWAARPEARVFVYETWHSLRSAPGATVEGDPGGEVPWADRLAADLPVWWSLVEAANAVRPAGTPPARLIPAGQAMGRLAAAIAAGEVPGLARIEDVFDDDIHPNGRGLYFVALVQVAAISGASPEGLPPRLTRRWLNRAAVVPDDMAAAMQRIAAAAVAEWRAEEEARLAAGPAPLASAPVANIPAPAPPSPEAPQPRPGEASANPAPLAATDPEPQAPTVDDPQVPAPAASVAAPMPAPDIAAMPPLTNPNLGFGLTGVNDWSVQQPFLNVMKTARPWIGHRPGQWGGFETADLVAGGHVTPQGWPRSVPPGATGLSTLVLTDLPETARHAAGRYVLTWTGTATVTLEGRVANRALSPGRIAFDYTPGEGAVILTLAAIDPADPPRDIAMVREDRAAALAAGHVFNPDWLARIRGVRMVRFMDWMATNNSTLTAAADRPRPDDFTWARAGVPMEVMVALANELAADPWFTLPHAAGDDLLREMAEIAHARLAPGLVAHVEYSNEVWNWQFDQARWADDRGRERWGDSTSWVQFYALRAMQAAEIWRGVFADDPARLVRVISSQTGWLGLEEQILDAPLLVAEGLPAPRTAFDAYAVTGYFAAALGTPERLPLVRGWLAESLRAATAAAQAQGLTGQARDDYVAAHRHDLAIARAAADLEGGFVSGQAEDTLVHLLTTVLPHHARAAQAAGLRLMMYEGGTHVVAQGEGLDDPELTAFFHALNYSPEMGELYRRLLEGWAALTDAPFNAFTDVEAPSKWGSWGALRHLGDDNPRWRALARGCPAC